jgi:hypothetical protein
VVDIATILKVELDVFTIPDGVDASFGLPNTYKLGYAWFIYGGFNGPLLWVNHQQQVFYDPTGDATGFHWQLRPGCEAFAVPYYRPSPAVVRLAGTLLDPVHGALANLTAGFP